MTNTETLRRLRQLAIEARRQAGLPTNAKVEIGHRTIPVITPTVPTYEQTYPEHDDLSDMTGLQMAAAWLAPKGEGHVVHLYCYTPYYGDYELESICVGWTGTASEPARLIDTDQPGRKFGS